MWYLKAVRQTKELQPRAPRVFGVRACVVRLAVVRLAVVRLAVVAAVALVLGCPPATPGAHSPSDTLVSYADALRMGQADEAYNLLSDEAKRSISLEAFRRMVTENPDDVRDIARSLGRTTSTPVVTAKVVTPGGDELKLVYEGGRWRIDGTGIDRYSQATPRQALKGFLRAYQRGRYDVVMRYVPDAEREGRSDAPWGGEGGGLDAAMLKEAWTGSQKEEIEATVQAIRAAMPTAKIEQTEDRAAMAYGAGGTVSFVRENGLWKIEELQ